MRGEIKKILPLFLVSLFFSTLSIATPNEILQDSQFINISVKGELWTEDSQVSQNDLKTIAPKWETVANSYWNNQNFKDDGKSVRFKFSFTPRGKDNPPNLGYHQIEIVWGGLNPDGSYDAFVERGNNPLGPHNAVFPVQIFDATLGHEVGHLMNLVDEYKFFGSKSEVLKSARLNGQTLVPLGQEYLSVGVWSVAYGLANDTPGLMSQNTNFIKKYYLDWIIGSLTQGWDQ